MSSKKKTTKKTKSTEPRSAKRKKIVSLAQYEAAAGETAPAAQETTASPTSNDLVKVAQKDAAGKMSGLGAAAAVLRKAGEPLNTAEMVKRMLEGGLWSTGGKTPAATIYAAIVREITVKGDKSRFRKTDRGHFELTGAGKQAE